MTRIPLLADSRVMVAEPGAGDVIIRPPRQRKALADVPAAVREALRFPLAGPPLATLATRGGTATVVIEQRALPIPAVHHGPRHEATAAAIDELERLGVAQITIVVAGGLSRRTGPRDMGQLFTPEFRRRFKGRVIIHDVESEDLVEIGREGHERLLVNQALVETDLVLTVTAAETVLHGGPAALLAAGGRDALRSATALSLLEPSSSPGWRLGIAMERALASRVPVLGVSLALNLPRVAGSLSGYPQDQEAIERMLRSRARRALQLAPTGMRQRMLDRLPREQTAAAVYAGPPSVAHAEALLRATLFRATEVPEQFDAIVIGIPSTTPFMPRERPNPVSAAYLGLGIALRMWRNSPPLRQGGTVILIHPLPRRFPRPTQTPYRALFSEPHTTRDLDSLQAAEQAAGADAQALAAYRAGHTCHPLQPFAEWSVCDVATERLGAVVIAGCRDAQTARQLGFVPAHSLGTALDMAHGRGAERIGWLLSPPYFPLLGPEL